MYIKPIATTQHACRWPALHVAVLRLKAAFWTRRTKAASYAVSASTTESMVDCLSEAAAGKAGTGLPGKDRAAYKCPVAIHAKRPAGCSAEKAPDSYLSLIARLCLNRDLTLRRRAGEGQPPFQAELKFVPARLCGWVAVAVMIFAAGCTSALSPMSGIPVAHLPPELLGVRRSDDVPVPIVMLAIPPGQPYQLDEGDILGVYIESVLPFTSPTAIPIPPPINFPSAASNLPPSIGFPIAVQADGMISLPLLDPFSVKGLTIEQARQKMKELYLKKDLLASKDTIPIVSLIRERTYNVSVIRENVGSAGAGSDRAARGQALKLPAYQNDLLHALTQTGGLPGFNEKNEVIIFKSSRIPTHLRAQVMAEIMSGHCSYGTACGASACGTVGAMGNAVTVRDVLQRPDSVYSSPYVVKVPLRVPPGQIPEIRPEDIELIEGDIVYVQSRESELFYTGGLLPGGQFPVPRDYDLDVLGAMALAGMGVDRGGAGGGGGGGGGGLIGGIGGSKPTQLFVIRKLPSGRTFNIAVDLQLALNNSHENILVQPGDTLILRYKPHEELLNFGLGTFFTFGIQQLFRGD